MTATRAALSQRRRRAFLVTLCLGTALSIALLVAATQVAWLAIAAVAVALAAGWLATMLVRAEVRDEKARAAAEASQERAEHRATLQRLHAGQREVLGVVDARNRSLAGELAGARGALVRLTDANTGLTGENAALRDENTALRHENVELRAHLLAAEAADAVPAGAEVVSLPRRRAAEPDAPGAGEVVDIARLATPFVEELRRRHAN